MSRRISNWGFDSLELMLDAICNVFGGITLVAILVVLQTHSSVNSLPQASAADMGSFLEARGLSLEVERLRQQLVDLSRQERTLANTLQSVGSPNAAKLVKVGGEFKEAVVQARARADKLQAEHDKADQAHTEQVLSSRQQRRRLRAKELEADKLEGQLRLLANRPRKAVRLPHRRGRARGTACYYVVKGNKVYRFGSGGILRWQGQPYRVGDCVVSPIPSENKARIQPDESAGFTVPREDRQTSRFATSLKRYSSRYYYVVFFVYSDDQSYTSFQKLKDEALDRGYRYVVSAKDRGSGDFIMVPTKFHETE